MSEIYTPEELEIEAGYLMHPYGSMSPPSLAASMLRFAAATIRAQGVTSEMRERVTAAIELCHALAFELNSSSVAGVATLLTELVDLHDRER